MRRSTAPKTARYCTSRCVTRSNTPIGGLMARCVMPEVNAVLEKMETFSGSDYLR
ncbi:hypothetical protein LNQ03_15700 [Klebsiella pneumoniae subsp. pneumoniae]|nr:hypothetical protein [Klebsiella pneumoniae subsp. pneumoniae]